MLRTSASLGFVLLSALLAKEAAAAPIVIHQGTSETPQYSPLPPPPPPPAELAPAPLSTSRAPRPPVTAPSSATAAAPASAPAASPATTTTTSASVPGGATTPAVIDPDAPAPRGRHAALEDDHVSVAPLFGFGTNNLELGIGVRAGLVVADHIWVGGTAVYHAGHSAAGMVNGVRYEASSSAIYVGPEVGYDFELGPVVLRPYVGIGLGALSATATTNGVSATATDTKLLLWPGATVIYGLTGTHFFVGADTRLITVPGGPAFGLFALGGMTF